MSAVNFIISLARKILARESKGITKIPTQMAAEAKAGEIAARLQDAGLPLNRADEFIKSEQDLVRILNMIESTPPVMREVPSGIRNTEKGKVFDMQGKEIPPGSRIMGGEEVVETEAEILERLKRGNKETVERIKEKKLIEDFDPDEMADGGRAGFMAGGMGRRAFLKMMAAGGAGIAGLKTGLINLFKPRSQAVEQVVETVTKTDAFGVPEHFAPLVNKIMKEGKLLKESDRVQTYKHPTRKDIDLEYEMDTGSVGVRFDTDQGMKADYYLKKSPPDEMNPRGGPDEFIEGEIKYKMGDGDTYYKGFEEGIDTGTSNLDDFVGMPKKSASGAKVKLPESLDDYASGGIARMLGE